MIDHVSIGVTDPHVAAAFYTEVVDEFHSHRPLHTATVGFH
jgi:hypothetical protein